MPSHQEPGRATRRRKLASLLVIGAVVLGAGIALAATVASNGGSPAPAIPATERPATTNTPVQSISESEPPALTPPVTVSPGATSPPPTNTAQIPPPAVAAARAKRADAARRKARAERARVVRRRGFATRAAQRAARAAEQARKREARAARRARKRAITYTVRRGDTLSGIAAWFRQHGYGALYRRNRAVIGANPNLIFPGQRITIRNGVMTLAKRRR